MLELKFQKVAEGVGRRIAEIRVERGLTQKELALLAQTSAHWLSDAENGGVNFTLKTLVKLSDVLQTTVVDLFKQPKTTKARRGRPRKK